MNLELVRFAIAFNVCVIVSQMYVSVAYRIHAKNTFMPKAKAILSKDELDYSDGKSAIIIQELSFDKQKIIVLTPSAKNLGKPDGADSITNLTSINAVDILNGELQDEPNHVNIRLKIKNNKNIEIQLSVADLQHFMIKKSDLSTQRFIAKGNAVFFLNPFENKIIEISVSNFNVEATLPIRNSENIISMKTPMDRSGIDFETLKTPRKNTKIPEFKVFGFFNPPTKTFEKNSYIASFASLAALYITPTFI